MSGNKRGWAVFAASACATLCILGALLLLYLTYLRSAQVDAQKNDVPYQTETQPATEESISILLLGCQGTVSPGLIQVIRYDAPNGILTHITLPPETRCAVGGRNDSLAGHYEYRGIAGAKEAVEALLGISIDRYIRIQQKGIANFSDFFGGVELEIPEEIQLEELTILPGRQLLDGRRIAALLFSPNITAAEQSALLTPLYENGFRPSSAGDYTLLATTVFYNCETDLNQYDFLLRQDGIQNYLSLDSLTLQADVLAGNTPEEISRIHQLLLQK